MPPSSDGLQAMTVFLHQKLSRADLTSLLFPADWLAKPLKTTWPNQAFSCSLQTRTHLLSLLCLQIAPKEDELRAFQGYMGTFEELSPPEQFLYIMASVPRLNNKINILILIHQFEVRHIPTLSCFACPKCFKWEALHP